MALQYFLYRIDFGNTLVDRSATSFAPLPPNTGEIYIDFFIPTTQPLYFYKESAGDIDLNDESTIVEYLDSIEVISPDQSVDYGVFTGYTAQTQSQINAITNISYGNVIVVAASGTTYTSIQAAIDSITGATAMNPYIIKVESGTFNEDVVMKENITIEGNNATTTIAGTVTFSGLTNIGNSYVSDIIISSTNAPALHIDDDNLLTDVTLSNVRLVSTWNNNSNVQSVVEIVGGKLGIFGDSKFTLTNNNSGDTTVHKDTIFSLIGDKVVNLKVQNFISEIHTINNHNDISLYLNHNSGTTSNDSIIKDGFHHTFLEGSAPENLVRLFCHHESTSTTIVDCLVTNVSSSNETQDLRYMPAYNDMSVMHLVSGVTLGSEILMTNCIVTWEQSDFTDNSFYLGAGIGELDWIEIIHCTFDPNEDVLIPMYNQDGESTGATIQYVTTWGKQVNAGSLLVSELILGTDENSISVDHISNNPTLSGNSDSTLVTEYAIKTYVDNHQTNANNISGGTLYIDRIATGATGNTFLFAFSPTVQSWKQIEIANVLNLQQELDALATGNTLADIEYLSGVTDTKLFISDFNTYTGTTAPSTYLGKTEFNTYSGDTLASINNKVLTSTFNAYTGVTATDIDSRLLKSTFNTYTGTTVPSTYLAKSDFNTYSGLTLTNINNRLLTSAFNTYSGLTLTNINTRLLTSSFNTYSGLTLTNINTRLLTSTFNTFTGSTISSANNGLNKIGTNVRLGGPLTGATNIGLAGFNLNVTGATGQLIVGSSRLSMLNPANTFRYDFIGAAIAANRTITLPLLTSNDTLVTAAFTQTLTNKTLTSPTLTTPRFATNGFIADSSGNEQLIFTLTASAVNEFRMTNAATNNNPIFAASGGDTNVGMDFLAKGLGVYRFLGTATKSAEIRLLENTTGGTNYVGFRSPTTVTGNTMYVLPNRFPTVNAQVLSSLTDGTMSWVDTFSAANFNTYTGTTAPATYQSKASINILTGTTLPATYQSKASIATYTGTTVPATYQTKTSIAVYTGTTAPNSFASKADFIQFTGTTAPATYATLAEFDPISGLTYVNNDILNLTLNGGQLSGGVVSPIGGINFMVAPGSGLARDAYGKIIKVSWGTLTGSCTNAGDNFIGVNYLGQIIQTSTFSSPDVVRLAYIRTNGANTAIIGFSSIMSSLANANYNLVDWLRSTIGTLIESGCAISAQSNPLKLVRSSGVLWSQFNKLNVVEASGFTKIYNTSGDTTAVDVTNPNTIDVTKWNDVTLTGSSALVTMTNGYWKKDMIFINPEGAMFYSYGKAEYATEEEAEDAPLPPVAASITNSVARLASFVLQKNAVSASTVFDLRPIFARIFGGSVASAPLNVIDHGDLSGLLDDDHPQYLTDVRGDIRYQGQIDLKVNQSIYNTFTGTTAPATYQSKSSIVTLTGTTLPATYQSKASIVTLTGTTLPATYQSKASIVTLTGTTLPNTYALKSKLVLLTGTTLPATYQSKSSIVVLTGTTLPATYQSKSSIVVLTGTTLPATYQSKASVVILTGTTLPATYQSKASIVTLTGTTLPLTYQSKSSIVTLTGTTLPATYQSKASIVTLTGTTLPATYQSKASIVTLTGTTLPNTYVLKSVFSTFTGSTAIQSANNGLTKSGTNVRLGGTLTGATTINATTFGFVNTGTTGQINIGRTTGSVNLISRNAIVFGAKNAAGADRVILKLSSTGNTFTDSGANGLLYGANYAANFVPRTIVDKGYVTGLTSTLSAKFVTLTGTTLPATYASKSAFLTFTGSTAPTRYLSKSGGTMTGALVVNADLTSNRYLLGSDMVLAPIVGNQSAISSWHGLQLRGNRQGNLALPPSPVGASGDYNVIVKTENNPAQSSLVIVGGTGQTANLTQWRNSSLTRLAFVNHAGDASFAELSGTTIYENGTSLTDKYVQNVTGLGLIGVSGTTANKVVYDAADFFVKEKVTTQTNSTSTLATYDTTTVTLTGGNYLITFNCLIGMSAANTNYTIEYRRAGANMFPTQIIRRVDNNTARVDSSMSKYISLAAGSHTFSVAFSVAGGTGTMYYSSITIKQVG